jgi:hypothetical protein
MTIDLEKTTPTMQEVADLVALAIRETVEVLRSGVETTDEALVNISGNFDRVAETYRDEPRFKAFLEGVANQVTAINKPQARTDGGRF